MVQIDFENISNLRSKFEGQKIVFCSGTFDLTHVGHIIFFEDCKKYGNILIVSVGSDKLIKARKGFDRPILNEKIRIKTIDSLKPVDYCFIEPFFENNNTLYGLGCTFEKLRPDVYVINEDASDIEYRRKLCEEFKIKLIILKRRCPKEFDEISTTKIINLIKNSA